MFNDQDHVLSSCNALYCTFSLLYFLLLTLRDVAALIPPQQSQKQRVDSRGSWNRLQKLGLWKSKEEED